MKKIAIVTGGTGGIGSAICKELGTNGYKVIRLLSMLVKNMAG